MVNGWKVIAIIFIVLFILETLCIALLIEIGYEQIANKDYCSSQCSVKGGTAFYYDTSTSICSCYDPNGEIAYQEVIK